MNDRPVDLGQVVAVTGWAIAALLVLASLGSRDVYLATLACPIALAAGIVTVRCFFVTHGLRLRAAFTLGQTVAERRTRDLEGDVHRLTEVPGQRAPR